MKTIDRLVNYLHTQDNVYIYGCGYWGRVCLRAFKILGIDVRGFMNTYEFSGTVQGYRVQTPEEVAQEDENAYTSAAVMIAVQGRGNEILDHLIDLGYRNIISMLPQITDELIGTINKAIINGFGEDYTYIKRESKKWQYGYLYDRRLKNKICRIWSVLPEGFDVHDVEKLYSDSALIPCDSDGGSIADYQDKFGIYMVYTDKDNVDIGEAQAEGLIPIQAGAALADKRCGEFCDDIGDNISCKNKNYCECTVLYWIWKNVHDTDYVGLCHYRRRLCLSAESVNYIRENDIDIVVSIPEIDPYCVEYIYTAYSYNLICNNDWKIMQESVAEFDVSYAKTLAEYSSGKVNFTCNLSIMKKGIFDEYCEFIFYVMESIEKRYDAMGIIREDRYMGYIAEVLTGVFAVHNKGKYKLAYCNVDFL